MAFKDDVLKELLENEKFIQWLISPNKDSDQYWKEWVMANPDKASVLKDIKAVVNAIEPKRTYNLENYEKKEVLDHIMQYADKQNKSRKLNPIDKKVGVGRSTWTMVAACIVIIAILLANFFKIIVRETEGVLPVSTEKMISKQATKGTKSSFYLPDGTLVKLNSSSSLEFPQVFSDSIREVKLVGQAFFEVTRNEAVPFIVRTEKMDIQVLGTSFDILSYPNTERFEVAVATGKVEVQSHKGFKQVLVPTEMTIMDLSTGQLKKETFDPLYHTAWKDGVLSFKDLSFRQVFEILENWYGVEIQISDTINLDTRYTGKYDNQSLENVLIGMASVYDFKFEIKHKNVKIY